MAKNNELHLQFLRGTSVENDVYTGPEGEFTIDLEKLEVRLHDGVTAGGVVVPSIQSLKLSDISGIENYSTTVSINQDLAGKLDTTSVVDNLTSTVTDAPLSANQGRVLKGHVDNINTLLTSDNPALDSLQEIVDYVEANRDSLQALGITNIAGLQTALDAKVDKVAGKGLSSNDYTDAEKTKLAGLSDTGSTAPVDSVAGKTGVVVLTSADVGLGNVDNTSDAAKPVSTAQQTALNAKLAKSSVTDTLTSVDTTAALSASQGRVLKELIDNASVTVTVDSWINGTYTTPDGVTVTKEYSESSLQIVHNKGKMPTGWFGINRNASPMTAITPNTTRNLQIVDTNTVIVTNVSSFETFDLTINFL